MAYFLKKTNNKKGTYLQIYSSFYDPERGHTAHKVRIPPHRRAKSANSGVWIPVDSACFSA